MSGKLFVVATPIGNLQDITFRAVEVLKSVSVIVSEDTRVSVKLLNHYGIKKKLISNFKENEAKRVDEIVEILESGEDVALISDAGTPLISDPGQILVKKIKEKGLQAIPIPGASSVVTALSVSGFKDTPFVFYGFFPKKEGEKMKIVEELKTFPYTSIFFEAPHRIKKTLKLFYENLSERDVFVAREMTKKFESFMVNPDIEEVPEKGEFVVILSPPKRKTKEINEKKIEERYKELVKKGLSHSKVAKELSKEFKISKRLLYNTLLSEGD